MANGKEIGKQNLHAFKDWAASKSLEEFGDYVFRGKLNRREISTEIGFL